MYHKKLEADIRCPLEYGTSILAGKWRSRLICLIGSREPLRYRDMKEDLINITDGVLGANLNDLINLKIVEKSSGVDSTMTEYRLTEAGREMIPVLESICRWSGTYYKEQGELVMPHCLRCRYYHEWKRSLPEK